MVTTQKAANAHRGNHNQLMHTLEFLIQLSQSVEIDSRGFLRTADQRVRQTIRDAKVRLQNLYPPASPPRTPKLPAEKT